MASPRTQPVPKLAEARTLTLRDHLFNIFRLVIKELRSIRSDPTMLVLVVYAFSISVNTVATGAVTEATNLSVGIADEDGSALSRQIAEGLVRPTFQPAVQIRASDIDAKMDKGELLFVVEIPPNFQANILAQRKTEIQINVDAAAVAQAGNGANYLKTAISNEVQNFINARGIPGGSPINLVVRADFNPNLKTAWFSAMTQVINQITLLTVILTGAALIREREQGTVEHLLVMPVVPAEIMLAKMFANGLVILRRRSLAGLAAACGHAHHWLGLFHLCVEPLPARHFRELTAMARDKAAGNEKMKRKLYEKELRKLQVELCHLQDWVKAKGLRVIVLFEGRDAAGKGGTIKAITERVSPRVFKVVALPAPSDREKTQMYVQRYIERFPAADRRSGVIFQINGGGCRYIIMEITPQRELPR